VGVTFSLCTTKLCNSSTRNKIFSCIKGCTKQDRTENMVYI